MEPPLSIEEAAQRTGLSAHTLRYYERIGLIAAVTRAAGGQRRYAAADLAWLAFLTRLRTTRMPIQKMRLFAQLRSTGDATVPARRQMLQTHLAEVQADISAMQQAAQALQDKIAHYQALEDAASAPPPKNTTPKKESNHG